LVLMLFKLYQVLDKNQQDRNEVPYVVQLNQNPNFPGPLNPLCLVEPLDILCTTNAISTAVSNFLSSNIVLLGMLRSAPPITPNFPDSAFYFVPLKFTGFRQNWVVNDIPYLLLPYFSVVINYARVQENFGSVKIQTTNAFDTPLIEMRHLTGPNNQTEINQIINHLRYLRNLFMQSSFKEYVLSEYLPGSGKTTDAQLTQYIGKYVWGHHACCTNKMGIATDPMAVVNSKGQVYGITNLRIVDISIFPKIPGYFPTLPIAIAAEKIANDIIQAAKQ